MQTHLARTRSEVIVFTRCVNVYMLRGYVANIGVAKTQLDNVHLPYPGRPARFIFDLRDNNEKK